MPPGRSRATRVLVLTGIVGMHGVLLLWLAEARHTAARGDGPDALQVRFLLLRPPLPEPRVARQAAVERSGRVPAAPASRIAAAPADPAARATDARAPRIDWSRAAESVAAQAARAPGAVPECEPTGRPDSKLPPCPERGRPFEWRREPRAVEFSGGLPYVRLGKRCAVGLGFFGCGIGKLPEANGALFEGMQDADRERSSVPDVPR